MDLAADAAAKRACFKGGDLKDQIAGNMGKDVANVKDSDVRKMIQKGAQDEMLKALKVCTERSAAGDMSGCKEQMKTIAARAKGKNAAEITDNDLKFDAKEAAKKKLGEQMQACMETAGTDRAKIATCRTSAEEAIKQSSFDGRAPSKTDMRQMYNKAAKSKASESVSNCEKSRHECMQIAMERIKMAKGLAPTDVLSKKDAEVMLKQGATSDVKDSMMACVRAKKEDASATCDDPYDKFKESVKKGKPQSANKQKVEKSKLMVSAIKAQAKAHREVCFELPNKTAADACLQNFKAEADDMANEYLKGEGTKDTAQVKNARKKLSEAKATNEFLGERFTACMKAAADASERSACKDDLNQKKQLAGLVSEDSDAVMKKFHARAMAEAASACNATERKSCREAAKADMIAAGMKAREYGMVKKHGEIMGAAEVYANCLQMDLAAPECETQAKEEYESAGGAAADAGTGQRAWSAIRNKIVALGNGIATGDDIEMRKKPYIVIDAQTNGGSCDDRLSDKLAQKANAASTAKTFSSATGTGCSIVDGTAEYSAKLGFSGWTNSEIEAAADAVGAVSGDLSSGRRLLEAIDEHARRLAVVSTAYSARDEDACASSDTTCGTDAADDGAAAAAQAGATQAAAAGTAGSSTGGDTTGGGTTTGGENNQVGEPGGGAGNTNRTQGGGQNFEETGGATGGATGNTSRTQGAASASDGQAQAGKKGEASGARQGGSFFVATAALLSIAVFA